MKRRLQNEAYFAVASIFLSEIYLYFKVIHYFYKFLRKCRETVFLE
jgi:hypothetical protein